MKTANIATAKNQFSRLIEQVKQGETILILDRNNPVARLQPLEAEDSSLSRLLASGLLQVPEKKLDVAAFVNAPRGSIGEKHSLTDAILEEREEAR
jgi:prevent-host-death family protein